MITSDSGREYDWKHSGSGEHQRDYSCQECGASVYDDLGKSRRGIEVHDEWHDKIDRAIADATPVMLA